VAISGKRSGGSANGGPRNAPPIGDERVAAYVGASYAVRLCAQPLRRALAGRRRFRIDPLHGAGHRSATSAISMHPTDAETTCARTRHPRNAGASRLGAIARST
jgi:hypothetical protein